MNLLQQNMSQGILLRFILLFLLIFLGLDPKERV